MSRPMKKTNFTIDCIIVGGVIGFLAFVMLTVLGDYDLLQAAFMGGVAFVAAAILLVVIMGKPLPPINQVQAGRAPAPTVEPVAAKVADAPTAPVAAAPEAAASKPATSAAAVQVKPDTLLDGEKELAARKGEWTYKADADEAEAAPAAPVAGDKPQVLQAARGGQADDLKQIKGIGPKLENMLNDMGFFHFDQIALWSDAELAWVDENLTGFKGRASRDGWVAQAKTLAAGNDTELSKRVEDGDV